MVIQSIRDDSKRERFLLALFPSALILAIYSVSFAFGMHREKFKLASDLSKAKRVAVTAEDASHAQVILQRERDRLTELKVGLVDGRQQIRELSSGWRKRRNRLENHGHLTEMMHYHDLSIISQGGDNTVVISNYLHELFDVMKREDPADQVELWPVEVKGAYFNMLAFLTKVTESPWHIIPVAITMEPELEGSAGSTKTWTIIFVI